MAESLVVGAAVGAVFGELLKAVLEMKDKAVKFKPTLAYLTKTLTAIAPLIEEIEKHNNDLGRPKEELESLIREMEEGTKLVYKCSKIRRINIYARLHYQEQMVALGESLERFFRIDMQAQIARDLKETLSKVRRIHSAVNKLRLVIGMQETLGSSSEMFDSTAAIQGYDDNAMEIESTDEIVELDTLKSTSGKDVAGTSSAEQVMEDNNGFSQKLVSQAEAKAHTSQATTEQFDPSLVYCISCGTSIRKNATLKTESLAKSTRYSFCYQCYKERIPGEIIGFEGCPCNFDLEDLLSASAEVIGKTSHGTTYKVILKKNNRKTLVMKRLKDVVMKKEEFQRRIEIVQKGSQHPNVMPILAWHYSKHEKLLIYEYMPSGNFSKLLHDPMATPYNFLRG